MLFSYKIAYKIITRYTPYQLVYGLHPLMPIKYIVPISGGDDRDSTPVRIRTSRITKLKKLLEAKMQGAETIRIQQWNRTLWSQQKNPENNFCFGDYVLWFPKGMVWTVQNIVCVVK
jgi:hypothetical protein